MRPSAARPDRTPNAPQRVTPDLLTLVQSRGDCGSVDVIVYLETCDGWKCRLPVVRRLVTESAVRSASKVVRSFGGDVMDQLEIDGLQFLRCSVPVLSVEAVSMSPHIRLVDVNAVFVAEEDIGASCPLPSATR